jgi:hypothetical protein
MTVGRWANTQLTLVLDLDLLLRETARSLDRQSRCALAVSSCINVTYSTGQGDDYNRIFPSGGNVDNGWGHRGSTDRGRIAPSTVEVGK